MRPSSESWGRRFPPSFAQMRHRTWGTDRAHAVVTHGARCTGRDATKRFEGCRCAPSKKRAPQNTRSTRTRPPARPCASARAAPASRASRAVGPGRRGTSRGAPAQMLSDADAAPAAGAPSGTSDGRGGGVATGWRLRWWRTSTERRLKAAPQTVHAWGRWRWCTTYMRGAARACAKQGACQPEMQK